MREKFMMLAVQEARAGMKAGEGGPFGAVVVKEGKVIAAAHNSVLKDNDPTSHAEVKAISAAARKIGCYDLSGSEIYTTTEPCPMCFSAIHWARISTVFFGTRISEAAALGFNELIISAGSMREQGGSSVVIEEGFLVEECRVLLREWEGLSDRKTY